MPSVAGYDIAGWSRPADATGGDTFDFVPNGDGRLMLLLGDATGHGIGPALSVTQVRSMLRIALRLDADLDSAFSNINDQLAQDLSSNRFVTAFLGQLDATTHRIEYHAGGQGPLLHFHALEDRTEFCDSTVMPMGLMEGLPILQSRTFELGPGDVLGLMTDGIFEYENVAGEQFTHEKVAELIREHQNEPMTRLIDILVEQVGEWGRNVPQADDMTIVLVRRLPD
jgi:phosphoserine phosphatase